MKKLARKEVFAAILQNLKRRLFYAASSLPGNTRVPIKVALIIYVAGTRSGNKTAAIHEIREILKAGKNPAPSAETDDAMDVQESLQILMFIRSAVVLLAVYRRIPWESSQTINSRSYGSNAHHAGSDARNNCLQ